MRLAKPDSGTHWKFDRGDDPILSLLTGPTPTFDLVDDKTGRALNRVYPEASLTPLGVWLDSWRVVRTERRRRRISAKYDSIEAEYRARYMRHRYGIK